MSFFARSTAVCLVLVSQWACKGATATPESPKRSSVRAEGLPRIQVRTAEVKSGELSRTLVVTGTLLAEETSNLTTQIPGVVVETPVDVGAVVKKGDVVLRLDDRDARMRVAAAEAALMQARARLGLTNGPDGGALTAADVVVDRVPEVRAALANQASAQADFERSRKLHDEGALSSQMRDLAELKTSQATAQVDLARNGVQQAMAGLAAADVQLQMARKSLTDTAIRAPFPGAVVRRNVSIGEFAAPQIPLLQLVSSHNLRLVMDVPETAINQMTPGLDVLLAVQAQTGSEVKAKIVRIAPALDGVTRSLRVEAHVDNSAGRLRPGMFVTARVVLPTSELALFVPKGAVLSQSGVNKVFLMSGDHVVERIVVVGDVREELIEVRGELKAGDRVVVKDIDKLVDGAPVEG